MSMLSTHLVLSYTIIDGILLYAGVVSQIETPLEPSPPSLVMCLRLYNIYIMYLWETIPNHRNCIWVVKLFTSIEKDEVLKTYEFVRAKDIAYIAIF